MALFGSARDANLIRSVNRELINKYIDTEVGFYKLNLESTKTNLYDESDNKVYYGVMKINSIILRETRTQQADDFGIDPNFNEEMDLHVHVPAGAIPKDGPSAGVSMITSLVSLITNKPVKSKVAMTGEITLRGNVLPIGGVKEKVTAAHRSGIKEVILPFLNQKDIEDVPEHVSKDMKFHFAKEIWDVLKVALPEVVKKNNFSKA